MYTVRPFGASIIFAGADDLGIQLVQVDPSGTPFRGSGFAIGQYADEALEVVKNGYRPDLTLEEAVALNTRAIESGNGGKSQIEHGVVRSETRRFERLPLTGGAVGG
jgi:20S proteasome alpha/beta subunit